jgi:endoglucanase
MENKMSVQINKYIVRTGFIRKLLLQIKHSVLVLGAALFLSMSGGEQASSATQVPASRLALLARGINTGIGSTDGTVPPDPTEDYAALRAMGFTYVRINVDPSWIITGVPVHTKTGVSDPPRVAFGLDLLDRHIATFVQAGFAVTLVVHPGTTVVALPNSQSEAINLRAADALAQRYAPLYTPDQIFFETLNEPHYDPATWNALGPQIVAVIRKSAPNHTIVYPPSWNDIPDNFKYLTMPSDQNIVYTMHVYQPSKLTSEGAIGPVLPNYLFPRPPGTVVDPTEWTYVHLAAYMHAGIDWAARKNVPLIMNEFGASNLGDRTSRVNWIRFVRQTAEASNIGWAYWDLRGRLFGMKPLGSDWDPDLVQLLSK